MHLRLTIQFGAGVSAIALTCLIALAGGGGPSPADAVIALVAGVALVVTGLTGRAPSRRRRAWLIAVLIAAALMFATVRGIGAFANIAAGGSVPHWWLLVQGAICVAAGVFVAALAWQNINEGREAVRAANARREKRPRRQR